MSSNAKYTPSEIEPKWQQHWDETDQFKMPNPGDPGFDASKPKYYILDMFPYPSGSGLHVGHPEGYTATDILSRYKRMKGFNVLHPMGWDAYGLPAENYAMQTGVHPAITTQKNIANMKRQIKSLGFSYDWSREINTTDPEYYRWTQWIFQQLYKKDLAYISEMPVWWCDALGTVLANEEVIDGRSERGEHPCVRKPLRQWMLRITQYAERLLDDLKDVDWPESIKTQQRNWIGKSQGAEVDFEIAEGAGVAEDSTAVGERLRVFTTRPDTLHGATYMVLSPEHPLVARVTTEENQAAVKKYIEVASTKSDLARTDLAKGKTGIFTGAYAYNPICDKNDPKAKVPIWIADYVLMGYGTGAIMAVPAHDTRDAEFAETFDLPITPVVMPPKNWLKENAPEGKQGDSEEALQEAFSKAPQSFAEFFVGDGVAFNSPSIEGLKTPEAKKKIARYLEERKLGKATITYRLRDWLFSRQRYWGEPFPVVHTATGEHKLVPESDLPVKLPEMEDFKPSGTSEPPLSKAKDWLNTTDPETGEPVVRELNTMPQWAGSCWYYLRYLDAHNNEMGWNPEAEKYWMPVDLYVGGAEHAVLHLLYARFWHKVLYDCGLVSTKEPFQRLFNQGLITAFAYQDKDKRLIAVDEVEERGEKEYVKIDSGEPVKQIIAKMGKSLKNSVNPDDVVGEFGADTLRLYEMFMGPLDGSKPWNPRDVPGIYRFLQRVWRAMIVDDEGKTDAGQLRENLRGESTVKDDDALERSLHKTIKKVGDDLERMAFNTAISAMMIFTNEVLKAPEKLSRSQAERFVLVLAPFAPHLAEELWSRLGRTQSLSYEPWPVFDEKMTIDATRELPVQVNGKLRTKIQVAADIPDDDLKTQALAAAEKFTDGKTIIKVIAVKGRLVNIVVKG